MWKKWRLTHQLSNPLKSLLLPKIINNNSHIKDILQENWVFGSPVDVLMLSNIYNGLVWGAGESEKIFLSENIWFKSSIYTKNFLENADLRNSWPYFCSTFLNLGFPCGSAGKESTCNVVCLRLIPGLGRSPGEGKVYPLQFSGLENSMDCIVHVVTKSQTWLSDFHF